MADLLWTVNDMARRIHELEEEYSHLRQVLAALVPPDGRLYVYNVNLHQIGPQHKLCFYDNRLEHRLEVWIQKDGASPGQSPPTP